MKTKAAETIIYYCDGLEIHENYSGRGMYGKTTTGVTGSRSNFYGALAEIMENGDDEERAEVAGALGHLKQDSMGADIIFY